ncbi:single-stranded DNA-binding protein [candidate division KSB1 bacterium]|nr:single-stranded DNA-binding protein [candidate division KSB1 bacterium]
MSDLKMPDVNSILIAGTLITDPILHKTPGGASVVTFTIASIRKYRDNSGIWRENICNVGIVAWHRLADFCFESLKKKSAVIVEGDLVSRTWREDDPNNRSVVEIRSRRIQVLENESGIFVETGESSETARAASPMPEAAELETPRARPQEETIEPTEFDFGYRDLKL